ncbi:MAG: hypothetical protein K6C95_02250 [Lachnospiraceae bacterium]|nr:hypothetical protein [Lachnospiraceae bacterium]
MAEQVTAYKCPACGGPLRFDGKEQKLKCDFCDSMYTVEEVEKLTAEQQAKAEAAREKEDARIESANEQNAEFGGEMETNTYVCTSCGAALDTDPTTAVTNCPYCGNAVEIAGQMSKAVKPDYCIPFRFEKKDAIKALKEYYKGKKLLPKSFTDGNHIDKIQGVYVPFWLFSGLAHAEASFEGSDSTTHRSGDEEITETKIYNCFRKGDVAFSKIPADGSTSMPDDLMDSVEPFDYKDLKPFSPAYMPGFLANRYDVDKDAVAPRVKERAENQSVHELAATVKHGSVSEKSRNVTLSDTVMEYAMFPVWLLSTSWEGKNFMFAMNGQTGKMIGNLPVDKKKATLYFVGYTVLFTIIFAIISTFFS